MPHHDTILTQEGANVNDCKYSDFSENYKTSKKDSKIPMSFIKKEPCVNS
ncbi:hypothetical protein EAL2_808p04360 (plasmid) [Peptoclostridium acidaminophilum DSM 3953]|uniref:Uncharacterized protein n=1 Tax=Peptoclostridium acidaminophilum DSM 3953 TaxID=1286171 RepID=W8TAM2_PEPAC|nr:hypothetical protein EAL2_808p04360 [Peptoclostridium acidaminophilum DSM 3953]